MKMTPKQYSRYVSDRAKPSPIFKDSIRAFLVGGLICAAGEALRHWYLSFGWEEDIACGAVSVTIVAVTALLTGLGLFEKLGKFAGAGTLVPISGFANSMAAPALEFKSEGLIAGLGAKMFVIAGPVLVYGMAASVVYGLILWFMQIMGG